MYGAFGRVEDGVGQRGRDRRRGGFTGANQRALALPMLASVCHLNLWPRGELNVSGLQNKTLPPHLVGKSRGQV